MKNIKYSKFFRLFGIILFVYILSKINISDLIIVLKDINIVYYLIGILFFILGFLVRILRWKILVNSINTEISFKSLSKLLFKGVFLGLVTPGKLGEFWRAKYLTEKTNISVGKAFYTAFLDRIIDLLIIGTIGLLGVSVIYLKFEKTQSWKFIVLALFSLIILAYFLIWKVGVQKLFKVLVKFLTPSFLKERANSFLDNFYQGFGSLNLLLFFKILVLGFLYYFLVGPIVHYFIALALGITLPFWYLFFIVAIAWLIAIVPVTVLGLGTREAAFIYFFSFFNISTASAVTFSLLALFCNILIIGLPGAILFLTQK